MSDIALVKNRIQQVLVFLLVQVIFFIGLAFNNFTACQAQANPLTPEAKAYEMNSTSDNFRVDATEGQYSEGKGAATIQEKGKEVKEKLNLDEPLPDSTKKFFRQLKGEEGISNKNHPEIDY